MTVPLGLLLELCHRICFLQDPLELCLLDQGCLFGWTPEKGINPEKQEIYGKYNSSTKKVSGLNPSCQVKGHGKKLSQSQSHGVSKTEVSEDLGLAMMVIEEGP